MFTLARIVKIFLLISFILILFNSYSKEYYVIGGTPEKGEENYNFSYVVREKIKNVKASNNNIISKFLIPNEDNANANLKENNFNFQIIGSLLRKIFANKGYNSIGVMQEKLENANVILIIFSFSILLMWLNLEFGIFPAIFAGISIVLNPIFLILSKSIYISLWSIILPSCFLALLLTFERKRKKYLQKQIMISLLVLFFAKFLISLKSSYFLIFTILMIYFYHAFFYGWKKSFALNRAKNIFLFILLVLVFTVGLEGVFIHKNFGISWSQSFEFLYGNLFPIKSLGNISFVDKSIQIFKGKEIYPHIGVWGILLFFLIESYFSFLFYFFKLRVNYKKFYYLFFMTLLSFIMAYISSFYEVDNASYLASFWSYPASVFTFAIFGMFVKVIILYWKRADIFLPPRNLPQNQENINQGQGVRKG